MASLSHVLPRRSFDLIKNLSQNASLVKTMGSRGLHIGAGANIKVCEKTNIPYTHVRPETPPIGTKILIPGLGGTPVTFRATASALRRNGLEVIMPAPPFHCGLEVATIEEYAERLNELITTICPDQKVSMVGYSWAAKLAYEFAIHYQSSLEYLVLVDNSPIHSRALEDNLVFSAATRSGLSNVPQSKKEVAEALSANLTPEQRKLLKGILMTNQGLSSLPFNPTKILEYRRMLEEARPIQKLGIPVKVIKPPGSDYFCGNKVLEFRKKQGLTPEDRVFFGTDHFSPIRKPVDFAETLMSIRRGLIASEGESISG